MQVLMLLQVDDIIWTLVLVHELVNSRDNLEVAPL